ncbi:uncharacterized protein ASPGLDRAFT_22663 [Aspergillus glaucus CBS 516.65]|uniref:Uncharacterized protein n=1 Tax=Aspergillus glaucus CBS 516.65 TaxID=1160497 RepID=A0A1L9VVC3_ASPGL|nr:hypothetical protein ASPGLDRAFT_22663 [Aspergillus glaucus CBS 516.65]OJJ87855.1 hypothetical protein ASPGLDRAFT_22663 [Aspergillus glaucus CBS 516.65]
MPKPMYGAVATQKAELGQIHDEIKGLSFPNGADFRNLTLEPHQHILREELNEEWLKERASALYARWCKQLGSRTPFMYSRMWTQGEAENDDFFLGASLDGYVFNPQLTGTWEQEVLKARFSLVDDERLLLRGWFLAKSPLIDQHEPESTRFGNCAKTYGPLKFLSVKANFDKKSSSGASQHLRWGEIPRAQQTREFRVEGGNHATWVQVREMFSNIKNILEIAPTQ